MRITKLILIIYVLFLSNQVKAGESLVWLTYGHSKFIFSPGIEACYLIRPHLGVNLGVSFFKQNPDYSRVINVVHDATWGSYSGNLGLSGYLFRFENHSVGLNAGFKLYYGPDYRKLQYYKEGDYYIYFDSSSSKSDYGLDLGVFYNLKKLSFLGKWDFARNRFRIGIGYRFRL